MVFRKTTGASPTGERIEIDSLHFTSTNKGRQNRKYVRDAPVSKFQHSVELGAFDAALAVSRDSLAPIFCA